jgi:hypothetical protein
LSGGWMHTIWIVFILTESDHTKYKVQQWAARHAGLLWQLTGRQVLDADFNDNRRSSLLTRLAKPAAWESLEAALWNQSLAVYQILQPGLGDLTARIAIRRRSAATTRWRRTC